MSRYKVKYPVNLGGSIKVDSTHDTMHSATDDAIMLVDRGYEVTIWKYEDGKEPRRVAVFREAGL